MNIFLDIICVAIVVCGVILFVGMVVYAALKDPSSVTIGIGITVFFLALMRVIFRIIK